MCFSKNNFGLLPKHITFFVFLLGMFYFSIYLLLINVYCSVVTFQCCASFYCITKWISHTYIYIYPFPFGFPFYLGYHSVLSWVHYSMFLSVVYFIHSINSAYESFQPPDSSHPIPFQGFPSGTTGKNPPAGRGHRRYGFDPCVGKMPWRRAWQPTPVFLPGESPWTEEPVRLKSIGLHRVGRNSGDLAHMHTPFPLENKCVDTKHIF